MAGIDRFDLETSRMFNAPPALTWKTRETKALAEAAAQELAR